MYVILFDNERNANDKSPEGRIVLPDPPRCPLSQEEAVGIAKDLYNSLVATTTDSWAVFVHADGNWDDAVFTIYSDHNGVTCEE